MFCAPQSHHWWTIWKNPAGTAGFLRALTSRGCTGESRIYCREPAKIRRRRVISIQYWLRFRAWRRLEGAPLGQLHSDPHDLPQHLCILRMPQDAHGNRRQWMRLKNKFLAAQAAPAAGMTIPGFHEVDGTLVFRPPRSFYDFIPRFIDLNEAAGRQDRVHGKVLIANVAVGEIGDSELGEIGERDHPPLFDHSSEIGGAAIIEARIHA